MCCFSGRVEHVSATNIFARHLPGGRQLVAYGMTIGLRDDVAMVLPIPTLPGESEDAVEFVDLTSCPKLFEHLASLFPAPAAGGFGLHARDMPAAANRKPLVVHDVGDFEASFVPSRADFARLDPRFRLPDGAWDALPEYADWGFAVFKLKPGAGDLRRVHPMAFSFPRRDPDALFFPTVHVHDGVVHERATFDHTLYAQVDPSWGPLMTSWRAPVPTRTLPPEAVAFLDPAAPVFRELARGELPNDDTWVRGAELRGRSVLAESFRLRVLIGWGRLHGTGRGRPRGPAGLDPQVWQELATPENERRRALEVAAELVGRAIAERGAAWGAIPYREDLLEVHPTAYAMNVFAAPPVPDGCQASFYGLARVARLRLDVGFRAVPARETVSEIERVLASAVAAVGG